MLCRPLVHNRWRDQLTEVLFAFAAAAGTPHGTGLHDLTLQQMLRTSAQLNRHHSRRRLVAALRQRRAEARPSDHLAQRCTVRGRAPRTQ